MNQYQRTTLMTDDQLRNRIADICETIRVVVLPHSLYQEVPLNFIAKRQKYSSTESKPVCLATPLLDLSASSEIASSSFELFTFYNWLRSGFRIVPNALSFRFEVFKGFGLSVPTSYKDVQFRIQELFHYRLLPNQIFPDSPYGILELGSERRIGGAAYISLLLPDAQGYEWLQDDLSIDIPDLRGVFTLSPEFCELVGIPSATCGQNIRRFANPFRISDLQLMMGLSKSESSRSSRSSWLIRAEAITNLSVELAGFCGDLRAYVASVSRMIGRISASLINHRVLHGQLTDHCQNITLGGELTEFDYSIKVPSVANSRPGISDGDSRLYSQVLLIANHVRHFSDCMNWIGLDFHYIDYINQFVLGIKESLSEHLIKKLLINFDSNPYCGDIILSVHNNFSEENLKDCDKFISLLRKLIHEVLS